MSDTTVLLLLTERFAAACEQVAGFAVDPQVRVAGDAKNGDYQCNAAMSLAGRLGKERGEKVNPRQVAQQIVDAVDLAGIAEAPEIAGPGFLNIRLLPSFVAEQAGAALASERLAVPQAETPQRVVVAYSSPNIAKQMHVGHIRTTVIGDALTRLLTFLGHDVIRQNHVGDWGTQFGMLIEHLREVGDVETAEIGDLESFYREAKKRFDSDDDFKTRARDTVVKLQRGDEEERLAWTRFVDETRKHTSTVYRQLGVLLTDEDWRAESAYNDRLPSLVDDLLEGGVAEESDGAVVSFTPKYDAPLMIRKSNGGFGYGTTDIATAEYRAKTLGVDRSIYVVGSEQKPHLEQIAHAYNVDVGKVKIAIEL